MTNADITKPELLAPAGTIEAGLAAFDAGADVVYAGLTRFNARERGENFSMADLSRLIEYARGNGRKLYVTLNTLVTESELNDVVEILAELAAIRPHAVMVQDIGLVGIIREFFPELHMHASTQMGIHNSAGVRVAGAMGFERVILERQVTYEEIRRIQQNTDIQLEVFVHGALCCGRSGSCLFSSWMGGWSGNRGKCKQPCRRRYFSEQGNGFFFSTLDLYSLDAVPALRKMGLSALKIEGRLRRADHVRRVVAAYRLMLDATDDQDVGNTLKEARAILAGALGRKWTAPFRARADFTKTIEHRSIGAAGQLCGKVISTSPSGFLVETSRVLCVNDILRLQPVTGDEGPALTVTRMSVDRKNVQRVGRGEKCWIHCDKPVPARALVFKTGRGSSGSPRRIDQLPAARLVLDLSIVFDDGRVRVKVGACPHEWCDETEVKVARKHPLTAGTVVREFQRTGPSKYAAGNITVELPASIFVPASELKRLRRSFWTWADATVDQQTIKEQWRARVHAFTQHTVTVGSQTACARETVVRMDVPGKSPVAGSITAHPVELHGKATGEVVLPDFCTEEQLPALRESIDHIVGQGTRRFRVTSLYALDLLSPYTGLHITACFPVPVCNTSALDLLHRFNVTKSTAWVELDKDSMRILADHDGAALELFVYGRVPLLSTRFTVPVTGRITDGRGAVFNVVEQAELTCVYSGKVLSIPAFPDASVYIDLSHAQLDEEDTNPFNYNRQLV